MPKRKESSDYYALARVRGFRWLGLEVSNTGTKTIWQCEQDHCWEATYSNIQQGSGCPVCVGKAPKTPADYHALAEMRGFRWLGPAVPNKEAKTGWECELGHYWEARYGSIQQGSGCPVCALERQVEQRRKTSADYHALAKERAFLWLGPKVTNTVTKTGWECKQGHRWEAQFNSIQQGSGCPICAVEEWAERRRKTPNDYHRLAEERGFRWLGPEVPNTGIKTSWECELGHCWEAQFNSIQQGSGCPVCAIERRAKHRRKTPDDYHALANERGFRWLGPEVPNTGIKTSWECELGHCWEAIYGNIRQGSGCPVCTGLTPKTSAEYHVVAKERGFRWLGPAVSNTKTKTGWECELGHCWEADYNAISQGNGCPVCADRVPKMPGDYHRLAEERGFRWLGPEVSTSHPKTGWECEQGHRWEAAFHSIQQGRGCAVCADRVPKMPGDYHRLAEERGFRWLGPEVTDTKSKTGWECKQDHRWEAHYNNIRQGSGCPVCVDMVQGARVSQVQRDLCDMLDGELNFRFNRYNIDVVLSIDGVAIAVEYDSWFWHGHQQEYDTQRDEELLAAGWRILIVKSNTLLPTQEQIDTAITQLLIDQSRVEIVLVDWGNGPTRFEIN
jgi:hypothetical protein